MKHNKYFQVGRNVVMLSSDLSFGIIEGIDQLREKYPNQIIRHLTAAQVYKIIQKEKRK